MTTRRFSERLNCSADVAADPLLEALIELAKSAISTIGGPARNLTCLPLGLSVVLQIGASRGAE